MQIIFYFWSFEIKECILRTYDYFEKWSELLVTSKQVFIALLMHFYLAREVKVCSPRPLDALSSRFKIVSPIAHIIQMYEEYDIRKTMGPNL